MNCVIYVDNDNIKFSKYEKIILDKFKNYNVTVKIFINENDLSNLDHITKKKHNLFLCNTPSKSKNSADISLTIECVDDIYSVKYDTFIIISNDTDFIPLCKRIHTENKKCILCYDGNFHSYLNEIYDETYDLSELLKIDNEEKQQKIEKQELIRKQEEVNKQKQIEKQKQMELNKNNEIKIINKLSQHKKNQLSSILEEIFNNNINKMSITQFQKKLDKKQIDYRKDAMGNKIKYKKYLQQYISNKYLINELDYICLKI